MIHKNIDPSEYSKELEYLIYKKESSRSVDFFLINVFKDDEVIATSTGNTFDKDYQKACFDFVAETIKEDSKNEKFDYQHIVDIKLKEDREYKQKAIESIRFKNNKAFFSLDAWFSSFKNSTAFDFYSSRIQGFNEDDFSFINKRGCDISIYHQYQVSITSYFNEERRLELDKIQAEKHENEIIDYFETILENFSLIYSLSKDKVKFIVDDVYSNHKKYKFKDKRNDLYEFYSEPLSMRLLQSRIFEIQSFK